MSGSEKIIKPKLGVSLDNAQAIADRVEPGSKITQVIELAGGDISGVFELNRAGGVPSLILKVYPELMHWKLDKEVSLYNRLAQHPHLPLPQILWHDSSKTILPLNLLVMTKIDGRMLSSVESSLDDAALYSIFLQMGQTLRKFHDIRMENFGYLVSTGIKDSHTNNEAYMSFQFDKKLNEFKKYGGDTRLAAQIQQFAAASSPLLANCHSAVFCHNDFHTGNIIVSKISRDGWRLSGVIDLENAIAGDPPLDIAKTCLYSIGENHVKANGFITGCGSIGRSEPEKAIDLYRLYHALEWWDWSAFIGREPLPFLIKEMERIVTVY